MEKETAERNIDRKDIGWGFFLHKDAALCVTLYTYRGIAFFYRFNVFYRYVLDLY